MPFITQTQLCSGYKTSKHLNTKSNYPVNEEPFRFCYFENVIKCHDILGGFIAL